MSFNKLIVPSIETLVEFLKKNGSSRFYARYINRVDAMMGDAAGIEYITQFEEKYTKNVHEFNELN